MKIPNNDNDNNKQGKRALNNILNEDFRMLICRQWRCRKKNTVMYMLRKPMVYYDKIYLCTPNEHQGKIQDLCNIMQKIFQKVGFNV